MPEPFGPDQSPDLQNMEGVGGSSGSSDGSGGSGGGTPASPAGVTATAATERIALTWTHNADAYRTEVRATTNGSLLAVLFGDGGTVWGLLGGTAYTLHLVHVGTDGSVSTETIAPSATPSSAPEASLSLATVLSIRDYVWAYATPDDQAGTPIGETVALTFGWAKAASDNAAAVVAKFPQNRLNKIDGATQTGTGVSLTTGAMDALVAQMERAGGLLALVNMGVNWLTSMTELVTGGIRRFKATALSEAPASSGGGSGSSGSSGTNLPDVNYKGVTAQQTSFPRAGRQVLTIVINADGGDYPVRTAQALMYVGTTGPNATSPPAIEDCVSVTPDGDGVEVKISVMVGTPRGNETRPFFNLDPGTFKFWVWVDDGVETTPMSTQVVTVTA